MIAIAEHEETLLKVFYSLKDSSDGDYAAQRGTVWPLETRILTAFLPLYSGPSFAGSFSFSDCFETVVRMLAMPLPKF